MEDNNGNKFLIGVIFVLSLLTFVTGYYALKLKSDYNNLNKNNYTESFSNLVNYVNEVENYLAKAMVSKSASNSAETLTQIWRDSNLAMVYLSRIPVQNEGLAQTAKYLNQVSDYSYSLSRKSIDGENLSDEDLENLDTIYKYSISLEETLNELSEELFSGVISWDEIEASVNSKKFAQSVDSLNVFSNIDENREF